MKRLSDQANDPNSQDIGKDKKNADSVFPIVGIGASAGGLAAFEAFFSGMPADRDPDMAFVLVQHLDPNHKSILTELIRRYTRMQVFEVQNGMKVKPNCAYIIPPNFDMAFINGELQLLEPVASRGLRLPINFFFRSLALDQRERAIGIVLSGTGSDGTLGVRAIKDEGGMVMAQTPDSTEYSGMPSSAIETGLVDYSLKPADMPAQLIAYVAHAFGRLPQVLPFPIAEQENALKKIFILLRSQTSHNFSQYKPSTIHRRISRRMAVQQIDSITSYVKLLQQTPKEVDALFRDLLIGVTNFFRDPEAFQVLEAQVIPKIFQGKPAGSTIRVWSTGCSSGEEAYSIAILLLERMEMLKLAYSIQVFATDIDSQAIATARTGLYPVSIAADISPERLGRYFTLEADIAAYRIHRTIRDLIIFSEQDLIKDPPFSRLDLVCCRNLLIYLDNDLQKKLMPLFHYSLLPGSYLFLGSSESIGDFHNLFHAIDRKAKLYQRKEDLIAAHRMSMTQFLPLVAEAQRPPNIQNHKLISPKDSMRSLTEQLILQQIAPSGALVNDKGEIIYLHGRTGMFLELPQGEPSVHNILKMAREGLLYELSNALHEAKVTHEVVRRPGLSVKTNGHFTNVNLSILPIIKLDQEPLFLVLLEEGLQKQIVIPVSSTKDDEVNVDARIIALQEELRTKEEYLQTTNEELETSNEELKSSNEEMQSVNEELQSTNEELETSKEELQSVNEELTTVNIELQNKVADLSRANNDQNNLLAGTGIATVFVDFQLRILRFTPAAVKIINLIASDLNRPVSHLVSNLVGYDNLAADIRSVLDTLIPKEVEVANAEGRLYLMRILPYRTMDNVIEGAVITFVDITEMKEAQVALGKAKELLSLATVVRDSRDAIVIHDLSGRILEWSPGAVLFYGWSKVETINKHFRDYIPLELQEDEFSRIVKHSQTNIFEPYQTKRKTKEGALLHVSLITMPLYNEVGSIYAIATLERLAV